MIRFSAALVAVAIGVLIGGIATSKLLLVYIAIVVSAVALIALAIGVVLKRGELFGEGQGLAPAAAGAVPVLPARAGESQDQPRPAASVPPSAPLPGPTASYGAAFGAVAHAAPPVPGMPVTAAPPPSAADPFVPILAPDAPGRDRAANAVPRWEAQSARDQWSSSLQGSTAAGTPDWMAGGQGANDPAVQAVQAAETAPPSWFDRRVRQEAGGQAAAMATPADTAPVDEDDDWPTRYSWLDDEADERLDEAGDSALPAGADSGDADDHPVPQAAAPAGSAQDLVHDAPASDAPAGDFPASDAPAAATVPAEAVIPAAAGAEPELEAPEPGPAAGDGGGEPPSADTPGPVPAAGTVAVLRGVPRYHRPDCVLIRFMPADDIQRLPTAQAKADGCTPCSACQPAE